MRDGKKIGDKIARPRAAGNKVMGRKTIAKYFHWLVEQGFLVEDEKYYKIIVFDKESANILQYKTLSILTNVLRPHVIDIYQYLFGRFKAADEKPYLVTVAQMKEYIGVTTSNNAIVARGELLDFKDRGQRRKLQLYGDNGERES